MKSRSLIRLAHFSDFHLSAKDANFRAALALVKDARNRGTDHIIISGDIVDCAELDIYRKFVDAVGRLLPSP